MVGKILTERIHKGVLVDHLWTKETVLLGIPTRQVGDKNFSMFFYR